MRRSPLGQHTRARRHPFHHYIFQVYALNAPLDLQAGATRAGIEKAMEGKIVARGAYVGRAKPAQ